MSLINSLLHSDNFVFSGILLSTLSFASPFLNIQLRGIRKQNLTQTSFPYHKLVQKFDGSIKIFKLDV